MKIEDTNIRQFIAISDIISLLNMSCGFLSVLSSMNRNFELAALLMIFAIMFDSVDGWVARKTNRQDTLGFGKNIDSLSDVVSFGLAPAIFVYSTIMTCSVFIKPEIFRFIIVNVTRIKFLRRFRDGGLKSAQEIVNSSKILKRYGLKFWCLILLITLAAWISRYLILNSLIAGFIDFPLSQHFEILCKHLVLWVTMLVSPTPGGVGFVEYFFNDFYASTLKDYTIIVTMIWRLLTFYLYLFIGVIILPGWIKTFKNRKLKNKPDNIDISQ